MAFRKLINYFDWVLLGLALSISVIGIFAIHSATHYLDSEFLGKQTIWILVSIIALLIIVFSFDYNSLINYSFYFYSGMILLLIVLLVFGKKNSGTKSWFKFGLFSFQPSELTKIAAILLLTYVLSRSRWDYVSLKDKLIGGGIVFLPMLIIALQPDLGTAMAYLPIYLGALFITGLNKRILILLIIGFIIVGGVSWHFLLKDYQKERVTVFLFPGKDPLGSGYHILQSKIAIGSGGFLGKGYKKGTQSQLRFLPARHTDFILSVIGEEFGYLGIFILLSLYFALFHRIFTSINEAKDRTGIYLIYFVGILLVFQFLVNSLMVIGFFPVTGIPMPFLSYGGSSLLTTYVGIGLIINVKMRKFVYG